MKNIVKGSKDGLPLFAKRGMIKVFSAMMVAILAIQFLAGLVIIQRPLAREAVVGKLYHITYDNPREYHILVSHGYEIDNNAHENYFRIKKVAELGTVVFCMEPFAADTPSEATAKANWPAHITADIKQQMEEIAYHGYYKQPSNMSYAFTQTMLWELISSPIAYRWCYVDSYGENANVAKQYQEFKLKIQADIAKYRQGISFANSKHILSADRGITLKDTNAQLSNYKIDTPKGVKSSVEDNVLSLELDVSTANNETVSVHGVYDVGVYQGASFYFDSEAEQDVALLQLASPRDFVVDLVLQTEWELKVIKKSNDTNQPIPGTEFEWSLTADFQNSNVITTDSEGKVVIKGLEATTVFVREFSVPAPFVLEQTPKQIEIKPGDKLELNFINNQKQGLIRIEKSSPSGSVLADAIFEVVLIKYAFPQSVKDPLKPFSIIDTIVTDERGVAISKLLPLGEYIVKEKYPPEGYAKNFSEYPVSLNEKAENNPAIVTIDAVNEPQYGIIDLCKYDWLGKQIKGTVKSLSGAEFKVVAVKPILGVREVGFGIGEIVATLITDDDGRCKSPELPVGLYDIVETSPPQGYEKNPLAVRVELGWDEKSGSVSTKIMQHTNNEIRLLEHYNNKVDELNKLIQAEFGDDSILLEHAKKYGELSKEEINFAEQPIVGRFEITKIKADPKTTGFEPEDGIEFAIQNEGKETVATIKTGKNGKAYSPWLKYGEYTVVQMTKPLGYTVVEPFQVTLEKPYQVQKFDLTNLRRWFTIRLEKRDAVTGSLISNNKATFELWQNGTKMEMKNQKTGELESSWETNAIGVLELPDTLARGHYELREIVSPLGYVMLDKPIPFEIKGDEPSLVITINVENAPQIGEIQIDKTSLKLSGWTKENEICYPQYKEVGQEGVEFELWADKDIYTADKAQLVWVAGTKVATLITDANGHAIFTNLPLGEYLVKETKTVAGLLLNPTPQKIKLEPTSPQAKVITKSVQLKNERQKLSLTFCKEFAQGKWFKYQDDAGLQTEFGLFTKYDTGKDETFLPSGSCVGKTTLSKSEDRWLGAFENVPLATEYELRELKTHEAYALNSQGLTVEVGYCEGAGDTNQIRIENSIQNELLPFVYRIIKTDSVTGKPLENIVFKLISVIEGQSVHEQYYVTDANGSILFNNLEIGTYWLYEVDALLGYIPNTTRFVIAPKRDENGKLVLGVDNKPLEQTLSISNDPTTVIVNKIGEMGGQLAGAELLIKEANSENIVAKFTSGNEAEVIRGLYLGKTYVLVEVKAPPGYLIAPPLTFTVNTDGTATNVELKNYKLPTILAKKSCAHTFKMLQGATFKLLDEQGNLVSSGITNQEGEVRFADIVPGVYNLVEAEAPKGYTLDNELKRLIVEADGTVKGDTTIFNSPIPSDDIVATGERDDARVLQLNIFLLLAIATAVAMKRTIWTKLT